MDEGGENSSYTEEIPRPSRSVDIHGNGRPPSSLNHLTLYDVIHRFLAGIFFPDPKSRHPFFHRIKNSVQENAEDFQEASKAFAESVVAWTRRGGAWRAIVVISIGVIAAVGLASLLAFVLFFSAATFNAVVISLLMSLAAAGGFLALFLACLAGIYIGALFVTLCALSTITFLTTFAVLVTTGWKPICAVLFLLGAISWKPFLLTFISPNFGVRMFKFGLHQLTGWLIKFMVIWEKYVGPRMKTLVERWIVFLWAVWQAVKKSFDATKYSLTATGSVISAYAGARHAHHK